MQPRHRPARFAAWLTTAAGVAGALLGPWSSLLAPLAVHADSTFDSALFALLNQDRAAHGLLPLQSSSTLGALAEASGYSGCGYSVSGRAEDMVRRNYFSHTILNCGGRNVFDVMRAYAVPFTAAGENMGYVSGISDPNAAARWINNNFMSSPDHVANILNPDYTTVGIGSWRTASGQTWSGAGSSLSNVLVVTEEFTNGPRLAAATAPRHSSPPVHAQVAAAHVTAPVQHAAPAPPPPPPPPAATPTPDDVSGPAHASMVAFSDSARRVSAKVAPMVPAGAAAVLSGALAFVRLSRGRGPRGARRAPPGG